MHKLIKPDNSHSGLDPESSDFFASANPPECGKATALDTGWSLSRTRYGARMTAYINSSRA
jgi:hypothetical protein